MNTQRPTEAPAMTKLRDLLFNGIQHRLFIPICLISGVFLRIIWIWLVNPDQVSDFVWFENRAESIARGHGYSVNGLATAYWPVGYPGFLGVIFRVFWPSVIFAKLINIAFYMASIVLIYILGVEMFRVESASRIALCILCFYPNHIAYSSLLATEMFFVFVFLLGAVLFIRASGRIGFLILAGLSWGLATLTKPQFIFLPFIFLFLFSSNFKIFVKSTAVIFLALLACIAPWMIRNHMVFGKFMLSTNGGIVLMQGNNPYATGKHVWDENIESLLGELHTTNGVMWDSNEVARDERARQIGMGYIKNHPVRTISLWPKKLLYLYRSDIDGFYYSMGMMRDLSGRMMHAYVGLRIFAELYYFFIIGLAAISLPKIWNSPIRPQRLGIYVILYFTAICLVFFGNARYHFAVMPWIAMYAGIGGASILGARSDSKSVGQGVQRRLQAGN
jgi:4-amino-4-deoxy-L-arabinose transferase-like glycosyltransferase